MALSHGSKTAALGTLLLGVVTSCSFGPAAVKQPGIDASSAGSGAMEMYDANGDGKVAGGELEKAPGLKAAIGLLDTDKDGGVSADEVAARVNAWKEKPTALTSVRCHVTFDGQPLTDAKVVFEPEDFLGDEIKPASAMTNQFGDATPRLASEDMPDPTLPGGAHFGLYKVRIYKQVGGEEIIPPQFNTQTTLGQEVSYDDPGMKGNSIKYELKSK